MKQVQRKENDGMVRADGPKSVRVISVIEVKAKRGLGINMKLQSIWMLQKNI